MKDNLSPKIIIVTGATASGKTALSVKLALRLGAEIVNADSMQVYRGMDIGTAKPTSEERKGVLHHLLDVVDPDEDFNAAIYRSLASPILREIDARGAIPLVVGGTGLYLRSLIGGLFCCPPAKPELRRALQREWDEGGSRQIYERLTDLDPQTAERVHPNDRTRITRALEIIELTSRRPSRLTREHGFRDRAFRALKLCLKVDRKELYRRINDRSEKMVEDGLVRETETLLGKGYSPNLKSMRSLGYRHMAKFCSGEWSLSEAIHSLQRDTRRYAKRQLTWFRGDPEMTWVDFDDVDGIMKNIKAFLFEIA